MKLNNTDMKFMSLSLNNTSHFQVSVIGKWPNVYLVWEFIFICLAPEFQKTKFGLSSFSNPDSLKNESNSCYRPFLLKKQNKWYIMGFGRRCVHLSIILSFI